MTIPLKGSMKMNLRSKEFGADAGLALSAWRQGVMQDTIRKEHNAAVEARCDGHSGTQKGLYDQLCTKFWLPVGAEIQEPSYLPSWRSLRGVIMAGCASSRPLCQLQPSNRKARSCRASLDQPVPELPTAAKMLHLHLRHIAHATCQRKPWQLFHQCFRQRYGRFACKARQVRCQGKILNSLSSIQVHKAS